MEVPADYVFPEQWWDLRADGAGQSRAEDLRKQFLLELGADHNLATLPIEVIASAVPQDDVLLRAGDGFVIAHLTWSRGPEPFLRLMHLANWRDVEAEIERRAEFYY